jgi:hypothetical protein
LILKRYQFDKRSEQLSSDQLTLPDEAIGADLAAIEVELEQTSHRPQLGRYLNNRSAPRCRRNCRAQKFTASRRAPYASVVASE